MNQILTHVVIVGVKRLCTIAWCLTACLTALLTSCVSEALHRVDDDGAIVVAGQQLPEFKVGVNGADSVSTLGLSGKPSVLVFFNTSCSDCRKELPVVNRLYEEYAGRVNFLCISRAEEEESVKAFWATNHLQMPYSAQKDRTVYGMFAQRGIPRIYVSDAALKVNAAFAERVGERELRKSIEASLP